MQLGTTQQLKQQQLAASRRF